MTFGKREIRAQNREFRFQRCSRRHYFVPQQQVNAFRAVGGLVGRRDVITRVETPVTRSADDGLMLYKLYIRRLSGLKAKHTLRFLDWYRSQSMQYIIYIVTPWMMQGQTYVA